MKNTTFGIIATLITILVGYFLFSNDTLGIANAGTKIEEVKDNKDIQKITISEKDLNYFPQEVRVKASRPVSISLDNKVKGCLRSFTIRDLGVSRYLKTATDTLDFTPTKTGTFAFSCSMGMGFGKLIVE